MNLNNLLVIPFYESSFAYGSRENLRNARRTDNDEGSQGPCTVQLEGDTAAPRLIFLPSTEEGSWIPFPVCRAVGFGLIPAADEASSPPAMVVFLGVSSSYSPVKRLNSTLP